MKNLKLEFLTRGFHDRFPPRKRHDHTGGIYRSGLLHTNGNAPTHTNVPIERADNQLCNSRPLILHFSPHEDEMTLFLPQTRWGMLTTVFASYIDVYTRMAMPMNTRGHRQNVFTTC